MQESEFNWTDSDTENRTISQKSYTKILDSFETKLSQVTVVFTRHFLLCLVIFFFLSVLISLLLTPFGLVLREDSYYYMTKSLEIAEGDFSPRPVSLIGWPLFMSPFFYFFGSESIFRNMMYARIISICVGALTIFPLAYMGRKILDQRSLLYLLILFIFSSSMIRSSGSVHTDALFTFLLISCVYYATKSADNLNYILVASLFAGLSYCIRMNGLFSLGVVILYFFYLRKRISNFQYRYVIYIVAIFFLVSAVFLYQRYVYFESPFFMGNNSKYFVENNRQLWSSNVPVPSLLDYLRTHTFMDYVHKFIVRGIFGVIFAYFYYILSPLHLVERVAAVIGGYGYFYYIIFSSLLILSLGYMSLFFSGLVRCVKNPKFVPLLIVLVIWIIGLTPVWDVFRQNRYLFPTVPAVLVFMSVGVYETFKLAKYSNIISSLILFTMVIVSLVPLGGRLQAASRSEVHDGLKWGKWAAEHVRGKIAIIEGFDLIDMHLDHSGEESLTGLRPGDFEDFHSAMLWFKESGVTHLAIDELTISRRPYLKEVSWKEEIPEYLIEVYSNHHTYSKWKMKIYYIDWHSYFKAPQ